MQFIGHEITVTLPSGFSLEKKPPVPESFQWQGKLQGSWGQGRVYYRIRTDNGRLFDLYYDRAPKGQRRAGSWILWRELSADEVEVGLDSEEGK